MCGTCGCGAHHHDHDHDHEHHHHHDHHEARRIRIEAELLAKNDGVAAQNRAWLDARGILAIDVMGAPGAGKTALLEHTLPRIERPVSVLEGDQETERDAERIRARGGRAVQITTGAGCHLDASMVARALSALEPPARSILFLENVGNLVCPALFGLGEHLKVVVLSVTEGDDKPLKYPHMFRAADLVVLTKADLIPYLTFEVDHFARHLKRINPAAELLVTSAVSGEGMSQWFSWLRRQLQPAEATGVPESSASSESSTVSSLSVSSAVPSASS